MIEDLITVTPTEIQIKGTAIPFLIQTPTEKAYIAVTVRRENNDEIYKSLPDNHNGALVIELRSGFEMYCLHDETRGLIERINQIAQYQKAELATNASYRVDPYPVGVMVYLRPEEKVHIEY